MLTFQISPMKKLIKITLLSIGAFFLIAVVLVLRPVPTLTDNNTIIEEGMVSEIFQSGSDIVFRLEDNDQSFYINNGLKDGLEINVLKKNLIGKNIIIEYPKYWTPLDWNDKIKHISKITQK